MSYIFNKNIKFINNTYINTYINTGTNIDNTNINTYINNSSENIDNNILYYLTNNSFNNTNISSQLDIINISSKIFIDLILKKDIDNILLDNNKYYIIDINILDIIKNGAILLFDTNNINMTIYKEYDENYQFFYNDILNNTKDYKIDNETIKEFITLLYEFYSKKDNIYILRFIFNKDNVYSLDENKLETLNIALSKLNELKNNYIK